jgi:hypothetical protein
MRYVIFACMLAMALACCPSKAHSSSPKCEGWGSIRQIDGCGTITYVLTCAGVGTSCTNQLRDCGGDCLVYAAAGGCPADRALPVAVPGRKLDLAGELAPAHARRQGEALGCEIGLEQLEDWLRQPRSGIGQ